MSMLLYRPISELDILKAIKCLKTSKSVRLDGIPGFIIKGCSGIFALLLKYIFDFSLSQEHFPTQRGKKAVIVAISKKKVTVCPLIIIERCLSQIIFLKFLHLLHTITCHICYSPSHVTFVTHHHMSHLLHTITCHICYTPSHYFKHKLSPSQFGVSKAKSTTTNSVAILISLPL